MTVREIAKTHDLTLQQVRCRIYKMDLKRINNDKKDSRFSSSDIEKILNFKGRRFQKGCYTAKVSERKKIMIIEYYLKYPRLSLKQFSDILLTDKYTIQSIIVDWRLNDKFLIIKSKM